MDYWTLAAAVLLIVMAIMLRRDERELARLRTRNSELVEERDDERKRADAWQERAMTLEHRMFEVRRIAEQAYARR